MEQQFTQDKPSISQEIDFFSTQADSNYHPVLQSEFYTHSQKDTYEQFQDLFDNHGYSKGQDDLLDNPSNRADYSGSPYEQSGSQKPMMKPMNKRIQIKESKRVKDEELEHKLLKKTQLKLREMDRAEQDKLPDSRDLLAQFQEVRERTLKGMAMKHFSDIVLNSSLQRKNNRKACCTNSDFFGVVTQNNRFSANIHVKLIKKQVYLGSFASPYEAAFQYDIGHVLLHGLKAKTNFSYSKEAVLEMMSTDYLFDVIHKKYYC